MGFNIQQLVQMANSPIIKNMMNSSNPKMYALNMLKQSPNANTEMGKNIIAMLERNDMNGLEQYSKNILQSQGISATQLASIMRNIGI